MKHFPKYALLIALLLTGLLAGCSPAGNPNAVAELTPTTPAEIMALLSESQKPVLVNVWASWCIPCRSEAPLLREAHRQFGADVTFIGIDVSDQQNNARAFLDEFKLDEFEHYFDPDGAVPAELGANGVPLTFFYEPGGKLVELHFGVLDERALAFNIDELMRRG